MPKLIFILTLLTTPLLAVAKLNIVTTTTDFADLALQIGGDRVEIHSVMKGPENIHNIIARPTEMVFLNRADLFVHSGLDAEPWRDNLLKGARNPKVMPGKPGNVDMSEGIELKEVPAGRIDRSMGDVHAYGNPHYSCHPQNAQRMAVTLVKAMSAADPANADVYKENAKRFVLDMAEHYKKLKADFAPYQGLKVVTFHKSWDYFADAFGLQVVATIEPKPSITPSPAELRKVIETMRQQDVKIVIVETYNSFNQAKSVAEAAGAKVILLPDHVWGTSEVDCYQHVFIHNIAKLIEAAKNAGIEPKKIGSANAP